MNEVKANFEHPCVIEHGDNWVLFRRDNPDTLDEIIPLGIHIYALTKNENNIWRVEFTVQS